MMHAVHDETVMFAGSDGSRVGSTNKPDTVDPPSVIGRTDEAHSHERATSNTDARQAHTGRVYGWKNEARHRPEGVCPGKECG